MIQTATERKAKLQTDLKQFKNLDPERRALEKKRDEVKTTFNETTGVLNQINSNIKKLQNDMGQKVYKDVEQRLIDQAIQYNIQKDLAQ